MPHVINVKMVPLKLCPDLRTLDKLKLSFTRKLSRRTLSWRENPKFEMAGWLRVKLDVGMAP
jgi:hypothetical protein